MRKWIFTLLLLAIAATLAGSRNYRRALPAAQAAAPLSEDSLTFLITFGYLRDSEKDYSGSVAASGGAIRKLGTWRFTQADALTGPSGWKLRIKTVNFENQPDQPTRIPNNSAAPRNIVPAGVFVTVDATASSVAVQTAQGNFNVNLRDVQYGNLLRFLNGDVLVQRAPGAVRMSPKNAEEHDYPSIAVTRAGVVWTAWQAYQDRGDNVYVRRAGDTEPMKITDQKGDVYRTSIAEDSAGHIHVTWSERSDTDWNIYERVYNGSAWSARRQITTSTRSPNMFHKMVASPNGGPLHLVWVGYEGGQSYLYLSSNAGGTWSEPRRMSEASVWSPDAATDKDGNLYLAWDSYRDGNYDIFFRKVRADGTPDPIEQVTKSPRFEAHASLAIDGQGRPWLAWDESGANWGKDWTHEDIYRSTTLYANRSLRVAIKDGGTWREGPDFSAAVPDRLRRYAELPHLASDANGRIWALFQMRSSALNNREDFWCNGGLWDLYLTTIENGVWQPGALVPDSTGRNEAPFQITSGGTRVYMTWALDGRQFGKIVPGFQGATMVHYDVDIASAARDGAGGTVQLANFQQRPGAAQVIEPNENEDVARVRGYRTNIAGVDYQILRGDFHRHTEISNDGSGDGSIEDYYRYNLDAAQMDTGILTDHNMGGDVEYSWWRTEKSYDLFRIRGRYLPLFGYERSVNYPNGHRNVVFDHRGVRTLPVKQAENQGKVNSGSILYPYLRQNRGIAMEHSLATDQGTDWRDNDPELEPLVEIYQGYHAAYEYAGGPRAESENFNVKIHGGYRPLGFWWNALDKGLLLGVQASSDHISTHVSYALLITPKVDRSVIVDSMRARHAYAATSNIVLDFEAEQAGGPRHLQGDWIRKSGPVRLTAKIMGTDVIQRVELIRNGKFIYTQEPNSKNYNLEFADPAPPAGRSYYYVRVTQMDRNLAWSSPIWVGNLPDTKP